MNKTKYNLLLKPVHAIIFVLLLAIIGGMLFLRQAMLKKDQIYTQQESLFLAKRGDNGKNISIIQYTPTVQQMLFKKVVSMDDFIGSSSTNSSGATDAVQFNPATGDAFVFTGGSSAFSGECTNKDESCFDRIYRVSFDQRQTELLFQREPSLIKGWRFNTGSNSLVVLGENASNGKMELAVVDVTTKEVRVLVSIDKSFYSLSPLTISKDRVYAYIIKKLYQSDSSFDEKSVAPVMMQVELKTGKTIEEEIAPGLFEGYPEITPSPNGRWFAFYQNDDLYIYDIQDKQAIQVFEKANIANYNLLWTGDSKKLFYILKNQFAYYDIQSKKSYKVSKYGEYKNTDLSFAPYTLSSSPSGRYIIYEDAKKGFTMSILDLSKNIRTELDNPEVRDITASFDIVGITWAL